MIDTSPASPTSRRLPSGAAAFVAAVAGAAVAAVLLCVGIAAIAHQAGASQSFRPLDVATFTPFVVVGLLAGAVAWNLIRNRAAEPARLLSWLVPAVVVVSLVPDILVGASGGMTGSSWGGVIALMTMHLVVAVCGVAGFRVLLPLPNASAQRA